MGNEKNLINLMEAVLSENISVERFRGQYENFWNFELETDNLSTIECKVFEEVFDVVVWYSPFPEERAQIPNYVDEATVLRAVEDALSKLCEDER
ncbi:hypothetical protein EA187_15000 [Lujinxingia sediminis]|uniref:Uncharacterized protein n=1 Tax=Lujinxingia sediminis TaxID=2480984 RepID=A0ABY0CQU6_9DELT|nr:hypothetical protein [Lujinxingia sediminis]RVU42815.1 hypothetical protein EA187_15000 [Lujinxingia sediminis]